jgi:hypothetical protein
MNEELNASIPKGLKQARKPPHLKRPKRRMVPPSKNAVTKWTVADDRKLELLIDFNPKSYGSPAAKRFELYKKAGTVGIYRKWMREGKAGGKPHFANLDLARDRDRGYIKF